MRPLESFAPAALVAVALSSLLLFATPILAATAPVDVRILVDVSGTRVDGEWKKRALKALDRIHSRGQFTNIESALAAASADWQIAPVDGGERHIILLTDGMVDVAKQAELSTESRGRILNQQLARIKALGRRRNPIPFPCSIIDSTSMRPCLK